MGTALRAMYLPALVLVALAGVLLASVWSPLLLAAAIAAASWLANRPRRQDLSNPASIASAILYAGALALLVVYLRVASGYIVAEPPPAPALSAIPPAYYAVDTELSVYYKAHVRAALLQFIALAAAFGALLLPALAGLRAARSRSLRNPFVAAAILIALCSVIPVPPFSMNAPHWAQWLGPGLALLEGQWPYLDVFAYYGFLPYLVLAGWMAAFGTTPLGLALLLSGLAFASALLVYATIARHGRSHGAAFAGSALLMLLAYDQVKWGLVFPNHSALRFHFFVALALWLGFGLSNRLRAAADPGQWAPRAYAFSLGLLATWSPAEGGFLLAAVTAVLVAEGVRGGPGAWRRLLPIWLFHLMGIGSVLAATAIFRGGFHGVPEALRGIVDFLAIFPQGYGNLAQYFDASWVLMLVMVAVLAGYCVRSAMKRGAFNARFHFCVFTLVFGSLYVLQAIGRSPPNPNGFLWAFLPCFLVVSARPFRLAWRRAPALAVGIAAIVASVVLAVEKPAEVLTDRLRAVAFGLERDVFQWSLECAAAQAVGRRCKPVEPVSLGVQFAREREFRFEDPQFLEMLRECKAGSLIVDVRDAFAYLAGHCSPAHRYPSFFSVSTARQVEEFVSLISAGAPVYFGESSFGYQERLLGQVKATWLARRRAPSACDATMAKTNAFVASALSDRTWSRGIARSGGPSVLLDRDRGILCHLRVGSRIRLAGSGERVVASIDGDVIRFAGAPLDPVADGYPHTFVVVR